MTNKSTQELFNQLKESKDISHHISTNENELISRDLPTFLNELLLIKGVTKSQAIDRSGLHQVYAYQIFSGKKKPSRDKIIPLCFGMGLTLDESQKLLKISGFSELYARDKRDSIIMFSIEKKLDIVACDELLYEMKLNTIMDI